MANHMAEVAKMLGVELGEEFKVPEYSPKKFKITINGIEIYVDGLWRVDVSSASFVLEKLLSGFYVIKRKPWKPKMDEYYWCIGPNGESSRCSWTNTSGGGSNYKLGNCYRTREEAEANRDKWVAFYASDEVLEV